jgi:putative serine protease PepD
MKGDLDMTEPVRLWSGTNGARAAHDWAAPPRTPATAPTPEEVLAPGQDSRPRAAAPPRGRLRAGAAGALVVALLVGGGVVVGDLTGSDSPSQPAAAAPLPAAGGGAPTSTDAGRVYAAVADGVVAVQVGGGSGTGFVIDERGTIVTNAHVVGESSQASVRFGDSGATIDAEVLGSDPSTDLAVLRVDPSRVGALRPLTFADSDAVRVGDEVVAIGHPFGLDRTATAGIVSGLGREIQSPNGFSIDEVIQTDAAINPGNSGGPLVDGKGRVVGVNSQIATAGGGGGNVGVGFAVPANTVRDVVPRLADGQTIERPYLGVSTAAGAAGVEVQEVTPGGPAQRAGLRSADVIRSVDGRTVSEPDDVTGALDGKQPGDSVTVEVERDGSRQEFDIELGTRPANP